MYTAYVYLFFDYYKKRIGIFFSFLFSNNTCRHALNTERLQECETGISFVRFTSESITFSQHASLKKLIVKHYF